MSRINRKREKEELQATARGYIAKMLPYLLLEVSSTVEFIGLPGYQKFLMLLRLARQPETISDIGYERFYLKNHPVPRVNLNAKRQRLTASFRLHLEVEVAASCGLATRLYPVRVVVKMEGNYATKKWLQAHVNVRLPSYLVPSRTPGKSRTRWPKLLRFTVARVTVSGEQEFIVNRQKLEDMFV